MEKNFDEKSKDIDHLVNCENKECNCLIHIDVYNTHKKLYNVGYCGICIQPFVNPNNPFKYSNKR